MKSGVGVVFEQTVNKNANHSTPQKISSSK